MQIIVEQPLNFNRMCMEVINMGYKYDNCLGIDHAFEYFQFFFYSHVVLSSVYLLE